jgi:hypothetical protein
VMTARSAHHPGDENSGQSSEQQCGASLPHLPPSCWARASFRAMVHAICPVPARDPSYTQSEKFHRTGQGHRGACSDLAQSA